MLDTFSDCRFVSLDAILDGVWPFPKRRADGTRSQPRSC